MKYQELINRYQKEISRINGLIIGIPVMLDESQDEFGFFDEIPFGTDRSTQLQEEARKMQDKLDSVLIELESRVLVECMSLWHKDIEIFMFFATILDKSHPIVKKYSTPVFAGLKDFYQHTEKYKRWKKSVLHKYQYTCQSCGDKNDLECHHLYSKAHYPIYRTTVENGIVLCRLCHQEFHEIYMGGPHNPCTIYDYIDWQLSKL